MDTPEKANGINPSFSTVEDSPVFNFINSLSPIKPVKSLCISQTYQAINFSSPPSIFSTPHVNNPKDVKANGCDNSVETFSSEVAFGNGLILSKHNGVVNGNKVSGLIKKIDSLESRAKSSNESSHPTVTSGLESSKMAVQDHDRKFCVDSTCGNQLTSMTLAPDSSAPGTFHTMMEPDLKEAYPEDHQKSIRECDWDTLMLDPADLLFYDSPNNASERGVCAPSDKKHKMDVVTFAKSSESVETKDTTAQRKHIDGFRELDQANESEFVSKELENIPAARISDASSSISGSVAVSNLYRGTRRRCLDYKIGDDGRNRVIDTHFNSNNSLLPDDDVTSEDGNLLSSKAGSDLSKSILSGIGLHLNALAIASKESKNALLETHISLTSFSDSMTSFHSPNSSQLFTKSSRLVAAEQFTQCGTNIDSIMEDASQTFTYGSPDDPNPSSPKRKRRKYDGEGESCKRCNCKKSKCLKLYCECFAAGVYCIDSCSCQECHNKPIHEDTVLATRKQIESRNPLAFAPKVIRGAESAADVGDETNTTPASARHKRGCNCKKSNCLKKYCECFQGGVGCSLGCRCEGCKNTFGRKDGLAALETESCREEDGEEATENNGIDKAMKSEILLDAGHNPNSSMAMTPISLSRTLVPSRCTSQSKPSRILSIGSSSGMYGPLYGKPNIILSQSKQFQSIPPEDEIPAILHSTYTTSPTVKSISPNSKRVSPPQNTFTSSPGLRSGRKLILQSIPAFPSLTPQH